MVYRSIVKKIALVALITGGISSSIGLADSHTAIQHKAKANVTTLESTHSFDATVGALTKAFEGKGLKIFTIIDHASAAKSAGLTMPAAKVIIFGNPKAGTPLMNKAPLLALQLPLKVLVADNGKGNITVSFFKASFLSESVGYDSNVTEKLSKVEKLIAKVVTSQ